MSLVFQVENPTDQFQEKQAHTTALRYRMQFRTEGSLAWKKLHPYLVYSWIVPQVRRVTMTNPRLRTKNSP